MKPKQKWRQRSLAVGLCLLAVSVLGSETSNPYGAIVERNPFGLKPPPPPPDPNAAQETKPPPCNVRLTGITSLFGPSSKRALLEIEEQDQGKKTTRKPILTEGQRDGLVEVLAIDIVNNRVRIRNDDVETELTFEKPKPAAGPAPGVAPPHIPSPLGQPAGAPPGVAAAAPGAAGAAPLIISKNREAGNNGGVSVFGGSQYASSAGAAPVASPLANASSVPTTTYAPGFASGSASLNLANLTRPLRSPVAQSMPGPSGPVTPDNNPYANLPPISREQAALNATLHNMAHPNMPPMPGAIPQNMLNEPAAPPGQR